MDLFIVRHGECHTIELGPGRNHPDPALTERGERQARAVAARLSAEGLTHILSSPLTRALSTAAAIAEAAPPAPLTVWPALREAWSEAYTGLPRGEFQRRYPQAELPVELGEAGWAHPGEASYAEVCARAAGVAQRLMAEFSQAERIALVTHGGLANALLHGLLHIPPDVPQWFELGHAALTQVRLVPDPAAERPNWPLYPPVAVEVLAVNDGAHVREI